MAAKILAIRLFSLAGSALLGVGLAAALLAMLPASNIAAAPAASHPYPGVAPCATTLQACINGLVAGESIAIVPGTYTESFTLNKAVSLGRGPGVGSAVILAAPGQRVLTVTGPAINSSVVISGLTLAGGHAAGANCPGGCGGGVLVQAGAQPLFENDVISRNTADTFGGGLYAAPGSPLTLLGVTVISNTANGFYHGSGGGVYESDNLAVTNSTFISNTAQGSGYVTGTTTLSGGLFQSNFAFFAGGGLYLSGTLAMTGTQFISNSLSNIGGNSGGAVEMSGRPGTTLSLNGGLFQGNSTGAGLLGGAMNVEVHQPGDPFINTHVITVTVVGTQFISNTAFQGGGLSVSGGLMTIEDGRFERNQGGGLDNLGTLEGSSLVLTNTDFLNNAGANFGGAYTQGPAVISGGLFQGNHGGTGGLAVDGPAGISGTRFIDNASNGIGGGAWVNITSTVRNALFQGNSAGDGGGLYGSLALDVANSTFTANHATTGSGGGLNASLFSFQASVADSQFTSNTAAGDGGGFYSYTFTGVTNTQFLSNSAGGNGGGLYTICCLTTAGGLFSGNHALGDGGGLYVFSLTAGLTGTQFISNSAIGNGGGVFVGGPTALFQDVVQSNSAASGGGLYAAGGSRRSARPS